jgi:cytochrome d ubiquinol oxidase subunit II
MHLYLVPMLLVLIGLVMYTVLAGADFGAGVWQLSAGSGARANQIREHANHAIGPVWEANHVWLIFVLTVTWTAYPLAFGSIASTLSVPLFIAAVGIILRGASYAVRSGAGSWRETRAIETVFALSSILTPFALGAVVGAIASRRVPVGNAAGNLISSWVNPTSLVIGGLAVATGAYLAAVYLAADAVRIGEPILAGAFRARALVAGVVAGGLAVAGLVVLHFDARPLYRHLVHGTGLAALIVSILSGLIALMLVRRRRYEISRYPAALAATAIIAGWAIAQQPIVLPGLTLAQAAAPYDTLVVLIAAIAAGAIVLFPSLALLFRLVLQGRFDPNAAVAPEEPRPAAAMLGASRPGLLVRSTAACAVGAVGLLGVADASWAHAIGVVCVFAFIAMGFAAARPTELAGAGPEEPV